VRKLADLRNVVALERHVIKSGMRPAIRSETGLQSCAESGGHLQPCNCGSIHHAFTGEA
jgi:hypothetical protein